MTPSSQASWAIVAIATLAVGAGGCDLQMEDGDLEMQDEEPGAEGDEPGAEDDAENPEPEALLNPVPDPAPDYVVVGVGELPAVVENGGTYTTGSIVKNVGAGDATTNSSTTYFLSPDATRGGDFNVGQVTAVPPLASGAQDIAGLDLVIPKNIPSGIYVLFACADGRKTVPERLENNNCLSNSPFALVGPDLTNPLVSIIGGQELRVGDPLVFAGVLKNQGLAPAPASASGFFLSPLPRRGPGAIRLNVPGQMPALAQGAEVVFAETIPLPNAAPGVYFVVVCADLQSMIAESDERNNCTASTNTITVVAP